MIEAQTLAHRHRTKAHIAYEFLREQIVNGVLKPGDHLVAKAISKQLEMSEIPVREALQRLGNEGLVKCIPHGGTRVSEVRTEEVAETLLIRSELEALATKLAAEHVSSDVIRHLQERLDAMEETVASGKVEEYSVFNRKFHLAIYEVIPYPRLRSLIVQLLAQVPRARSVFMLNPTRVRESHEEHKELLNALRAGDGKRAADIVRAQKLKAMETFLHGQ